MKNIRALVVGNWKMNPQSHQAATRLASDLKKGLLRKKGVDVVLAPPSVFIAALGKVRNGSKAFALGAQDVHWEKLGPHTGETSASMLKSFEVAYVIVGHSERRASGETDESVNKKVRTLLKEGIIPIVCVGEKKRDTAGHYLSLVEHQVRAACAGLSRTKLPQFVIAYEPIWAISSGDGKGRTAIPADAHEMKIFIQKVLTDIYGRNYAHHVRILYGGSVNAKNAEALMTEGMVDGFLVGGASLRADEFMSVVDATQ